MTKNKHLLICDEKAEVQETTERTAESIENPTSKVFKSGSEPETKQPRENPGEESIIQRTPINEG